MPIHVTTSTTQSLSNKTFVDRVSTTGVVYADSGNSNQWSSAYNTVYTASGSWAAQTLSFDENTAILSIANNGNTVSLSALSGGGSSGPVSETDPVFTTWAQANSAKYESTYSTVSAITGNLILGQLGISIFGGFDDVGAGVVISTGMKQYLRVPYNCTLTSYEVVARPTGSIEFGIYRSTYENFPPPSTGTAGQITGAERPRIDNNVKNKQTNLQGYAWVTNLTAGDYLLFTVTEVTAVTAATLTLTTLR